MSTGETQEDDPPASRCYPRFRVDRWYLAMEFGNREFGIGWWKGSSKLLAWDSTYCEGNSSVERLGSMGRGRKANHEKRRYPRLHCNPLFHGLCDVEMVLAD